MTVDNAHGVYGIDVAGTPLGGITDISLPTNTVLQGNSSDGNIYNRFVSMFSQSPIPTFTTQSVAAALALIGVEGLAIATGSVLTMYAQKRQEGGSRVSTNNHQQFLITEGIVFPTSLSVSQDGDATISYTIVVRFDGTNEPIIITGSATLPDTTDAVRWGLGKVWLEDVAIVSLTGIDIDFGITATPVFADGDVRPTHVSIDTIDPTITIKTKDPTLGISSIPLAGLVGTKANTSIFLHKRLQGGQYVADATAEHLKISAAGPIAIEDAFSASGATVGEMSIIMKPYDDGSNTPIVVTADQAIAAPA